MTTQGSPLDASTTETAKPSNQELAEPNEMWKALLDEYREQIKALTSRLVAQRRELRYLHEGNSRGNEFAYKRGLDEGVARVEALLAERDAAIHGRDLARLDTQREAECVGELAGRVAVLEAALREAHENCGCDRPGNPASCLFPESMAVLAGGDAAGQEQT